MAVLSDKGEKVMLIRNARALRHGDFIPETDVRLEGGVIASVGHLTARDGETVLDAERRYLLPGFVDVHIHAFKCHDAMRGESNVRAMSRDLAELGVAAFLPTTMSASKEDTEKAVAGIRAVMVRPEEEGARVMGAHMEAPFLQQTKCGAQLAEFFEPPSMKCLLNFTGGDLGAVRMITVAPELDGADTFIREAAEANIVVSVGHTAATAAQTHAAADCGARHITHTFNAQTPLNHREPGVPGAALTDERYFCQMITDCIHLHPDTLKLIWKAKGRERAVVITDAMEAAGMPEGEYELGGQKVYVKDGSARLASGTLAGSVLTMPQALMNLIRIGIPANDAAVMCTRTPALSIGESVLGTLQPGSPAPLTLWSADWDEYEIILG